ncbi:MAG: hypothetical protein AB8G22_24690 [Saprospiraceae bacterium]
MKSKVNFLIIFLLAALSISAQTIDNTSWLSIKLQQNYHNGLSLALVPIVRLNENVSNYDNSSIDLVVQQKFKKGWSGRFVHRTWFIPEGTGRYFFWLDAIYGKKFEKIGLSSFVRYHHAVNTKERNDSDFIRWKTTLSLINVGKISPFFAFEPWYQFDGFDQIRRLRFEPGIKWKFNPNLVLTAMYRREVSQNREDPRNFNMYVVNLAYIFAKKKE